MHLHARIAGTIGVVALITAGLAGTAQVAAAASGVVGHVYVNDNTAGTNTIGGFDQHADGTLTVMSGSPFTGGAAPADRRFPGSLSDERRPVPPRPCRERPISVVRVRPDGTLSRTRQPGGIGRHRASEHRRHDGLVTSPTGNGTGAATGFPAEQRRPDFDRRVDIPLPATAGRGTALSAARGTT
jgi:hypothetical protein